jgi:hypothetical protein
MSSFDDAVDDTAAATEREESVLRDVLEELDRERTRRAELEDQVRKLQQEAAQAEFRRVQEAKHKEESVPHDVYVTMETQLRGFQELVDALTMGKPAIAAAAAAEDAAAISKGTRPRLSNPNLYALQQQPPHKKTLPLHVVRMLEVLPWDPRATQYIFATEEIFEWQIYREGAWQSHMRFFPTLFKTLPILKSDRKLKQLQQQQQQQQDDELGDDDFSSSRRDSTAFAAGVVVGSGTPASSNHKKERNILTFLAGGDALSVSKRKGVKNRVLTNEHMTALYDIDAGYPLPKNGGVWEWVGGWRIGKRSKKAFVVEPDSEDGTSSSVQKPDCDEEGWSYVHEPQHFLVDNADLVWENPGVEFASTPTRKNEGSSRIIPKRIYRRRRWTRQRILVDYLYASKSTQQYLKLLVENARLSMTVGKISDQLLETKTALTEAEAKIAGMNNLHEENDKVHNLVGFDWKSSEPSSKLKPVEMKDLTFDSVHSTASLDSASKFFPEAGGGGGAPQSQSIGSKSDLGKEISNKISQLFQGAARKSSEDMTEESIEEMSSMDHRNGSSPLPEKPVDPSSSSQQQQQQQHSDKFDWKKIGRGHLINQFEKFKHSPGPNPNKKGSSALADSAKGIFRLNSKVGNETSSNNNNNNNNNTNASVDADSKSIL